MTNSALLKYFLEKNGLTQTKLAELLGVEFATINNKILGKREFTTGEIVKIQNILKLTLEEKEAIFFDCKGAENSTI